MLLRVAGWSLAAFLAAVPAAAGVELDVIANAGTAAESAPPATMPAAPAEAGKPAIIHETGAAVAIRRAIETAERGEADPPKVAALEPVAPRSDLPRIDAPFRFSALPVTSGQVLAKWNAVEADIHAESMVFARCRVSPDTCPRAAKSFLDIVDQGRVLTGRARIGVINRAINLAIEPTSDMAQWGVPDHWSAPLDTFTTRKGDCEDYAIAKYVALTEAGIAAADVKLVIVHNTAANEDHAVAAVRLDGSWIILDNRWLRLVDDVAMPQAVPLFVLDGDGVRQFLPDRRLTASGVAAPASLAN
jgi:predicted transglutaminase-like cysteine proteinase